MSSQRKIIFLNDYIYHVFNCGIERRPTFTNNKEYYRALQLMKFYRHKEIPIRFSQVVQQKVEIRNKMFDNLYKSEKIVEILGYCLMPNHFHVILKQKCERGISDFVSKFTNAYTKFFNTKHKRIGPLFQGVFKAVLVESEEQLIHLSRYIHLNPVASSVIGIEEIENYFWSSYSEYLSLSGYKITNTDLILGLFKTVKKYKQFVVDYADYAKQLHKIKHLSLE